MSRPLFSVRWIDTEALLPRKLEPGRAYFIRDEQIIVIDMGDGRGPVRYGDKPGPQGQSGEPIPSLQGQIDELASASLATSRNIHILNMKTRTDYSHVEGLIADLTEKLEEQSNDLSKAAMSLIVICHNAFKNYDSALATLANALANLYPSGWGGHAGDGTNDITAGEIISANGNEYIVDEAYYDGDTGVAVLRLYSSDNRLQQGEIVSMDSGYFVVNDITTSGNTGIITITLFEG